jgi:hypothetical protein
VHGPAPFGMQYSNASIRFLQGASFYATIRPMIRWNITAQAKRHGIPNAHQLAAKAGLTLPVAYRVWSGEPLERIDVLTLEKLTHAFKLKSPWTLLEYS